MNAVLLPDEDIARVTDMFNSLLGSAKEITQNTFVREAFHPSARPFVKRVMTHLRACVLSDVMRENINRLNECSAVACNTFSIGISVSATTFVDEHPNMNGLLQLIFDVIIHYLIPRMKERNGVIECNTSAGSVIIYVSTSTHPHMPSDRLLVLVTLGVHDDATNTCTAITTSSYALYRNRREVYRNPLCIVCLKRTVSSCLEYYCSNECLLSDLWIVCDDADET